MSSPGSLRKLIKLLVIICPMASYRLVGILYLIILVVCYYTLEF